MLNCCCRRLLHYPQLVEFSRLESFHFRGISARLPSSVRNLNIWIPLSQEIHCYGDMTCCSLMRYDRNVPFNSLLGRVFVRTSTDFIEMDVVPSRISSSFNQLSYEAFFLSINSSFRQRFILRCLLRENEIREAERNERAEWLENIHNFHWNRNPNESRFAFSPAVRDLCMNLFNFLLFTSKRTCWYSFAVSVGASQHFVNNSFLAKAGLRNAAQTPLQKKGENPQALGAILSDFSCQALFTKV